MKYLVLIVSFFLLGCEGFKINASMCESLQPGEVSSECRNYNDDEATKASLPMYDENGECLRCKKAEKIEIRK
ncbi:MAG TPA: hypothetical protein EYO73_06985 [Sulfurimonas sp.]|nr:hypothetical protein [Sulfurimonas sp.]